MSQFHLKRGSLDLASAKAYQQTASSHNVVRSTSFNHGGSHWYSSEDAVGLIIPTPQEVHEANAQQPPPDLAWLRQ